MSIEDTIPLASIRPVVPGAALVTLKLAEIGGIRQGEFAGECVRQLGTPRVGPLPYARIGEAHTPQVCVSARSPGRGGTDGFAAGRSTVGPMERGQWGKGIARQENGLGAYRDGASTV